MSYTELIDALTFLKENRKLGSEADELVAPFKGLVCSARFRFESLSRTFANPHDPQFEGGQTMVGDLLGSEVDFSLLLPPAQTEWAESLERGDEFELSVSFLGFDGLYQRGIFGYQGKIEVAGIDEATTDEPEEETVDFVVEEDPMEDDGEPIEELEEPTVVLSGDQPLEERETPSVQPQLRKEEEVSESETVPQEEIQEDHTDETNPDSEDGMEEPEQEASTEDVYPIDPQIEEVDEVSDDLEKQNSGSKPDADDQANLIVKRPGPVVDHSTNEKELSPEEIRRIMDRGRTWGVSGLSKKEQVIYHSEITRTKIDRSEVMRILDKEFNRGIQSLTEDERHVYDKVQAKRKKRSLRKKKNKPKKPRQYRLFLAIMLLFLSVIALGNGAVGLFFFFCFLIVYVLHPWISFWLEEDPCTQLFRTRLFKEPKFRSGAGLLVLSFCLFSSALILAVPLFFVALFLMHGTKTFKDIQKGFPDEGRIK
jgi:hypothetical protein